MGFLPIPRRAFLTRLKHRWGKLPGNLRGILWSLASGAGYTIMIALIKIAGQTIHITEILLFRQSLMLIIVSPVILRSFPDALKSSRIDLQLVRVVCAISAMLMGFTAAIHLPLADVTTIGFAKAFFVTIGAIFILSEVVGIRRWLAIIVGFVGVIIVAQPSGGGAISIYGLMAIAGSGFAGITSVIIRKLSQTDRPVTILSYQAICVGLFMIPPAIWFWKTPSNEELVLLIAIGVLSAITQFTNILAYRAGEATVIAPLEYVRLLYATIIGFLVFSDWPGVNVFAGAAIIILAAFYTVRREAKKVKVPRQ
ncbi:MAG: DMT family transporter [Methyloligellaceae bacterium]